MNPPGAGRAVALSRPLEGAQDARPLVVCATKFRDPGGWRWFENHYADRLRWEFHHATPSSLLERQVSRPNLALARGCWDAVRGARRDGAGLLVSHDPHVTARCAAFLRMTGARVPHVAWSFNLAELPHGLNRRLMAAAFRHVDRFVVYSTMERALYGEVFGIPLEKIDLLLWGVGEPEVTRPDEPLEPGDYICAIGGNGRDYATLMAAMARLPEVPLVAVMRPGNLAGLTIPPNVRIRVNIPGGEANNILRFSRFMVLPLAGTEVPCGHVTLVNAMFLGRAFLITSSSGVYDYVQEDVNSLTCEAFSPKALAARIRELWNDPDRCARLGRGGRQFADRHCREESVRHHLDAVLRSFGLLV
jgi:glycosyltransferase involved in cell wall biosynthesis